MPSPADTNRSGASPAPARTTDRRVAGWLLAVAALVFVMALIGAITRLTESGLSMVAWEPVRGILPPLGKAAWQAEFARYQDSPQFHQRFPDMELGGFKKIYFWEWLHRAFGRAIGLVFLAGLIPALASQALTPRFKLALTGLFLLGGMQGVMGWIMVRSGLVDVPEVSHFRLAAHLGLAFVTWALLIWAALTRLRPTPAATRGLPPARRRALARGTDLLLLGVALTVIYGAFVAGRDAGLIYNSFPLMNGRLLPEGLGRAPWLELMLTDRGLIQFIHRWLALATGAGGLALAGWLWRARPAAPIPALAAGLAALICVQIGLGIATLLLQVPITLATAHQAGALLIVGLLAWLRFELRAGKSDALAQSSLPSAAPAG